jgi:hypothetical protein
MGELGMDTRVLDCFRRVLELPHGIILVTGPTGSGKTSTLYTPLNEINDSVRKIITIEDPIEYQLKGVNQIQVSEKGRADLRPRTALDPAPRSRCHSDRRNPRPGNRQIAVQASLTGHLVFSTLHTNDAPGALTRLVDMGVEPYLVASSLEAVLAQRLVRVLCRHCRAGGYDSPAAQVFKDASASPPPPRILSLGRLPRMPPDRFLRPPRHLRMDGFRRRNPGVDPQEWFQRQDPRRRPPRRHAHVGGRRLAARQRRAHHGRGSSECDHRQRSRAPQRQDHRTRGIERALSGGHS